MTLAKAMLAAIKASRYLQIGIAMLLGLIGWHSWLAMHDGKVTSKVVARIEKQNTTLAAKGSEARKAAAKPGAMDRLRQRYGEGQ